MCRSCAEQCRHSKIGEHIPLSQIASYVYDSCYNREASSYVFSCTHCSNKEDISTWTRGVLKRSFPHSYTALCWPGRQTAAICFIIADNIFVIIMGFQRCFACVFSFELLDQDLKYRKKRFSAWHDIYPLNKVKLI